MGSGKTSTGKSLAAMLGLEFTDFDIEIEKKEGRSIAAIFKESGEPYFRDVEASVLKEASQKTDHVVSTGGGIVLREDNVQLMRRTGAVVLLKASAKTLWQRLQYATNRPLLNKPDPLGTMQRILEDREKIYETACHFSVVTDGKIADDVAREIRMILRPI